MTGTDSTARVLLHVLGPVDADDEEVADLVGSLREDVLDLDVDDAQPLSEGAAPEGSKGAVLAAAGWLVVQLGPVAAKALLERVLAWVQRDSSRSVELTIGDNTLKVGRISGAEQKRLIDEWLALQARPS